MKLPLDFLVPTKEDYHTAVNKLVEDAKDIPNIDSILLYGSAARGNLTFGRSDIDILIAIKGGVKTSTDALKEIGNIIRDITEKNHVRFQFNICDKKTMCDGRFFSFTSEYKDHFKREGKIIYGNDCRKYMKMLTWKHFSETHIAFDKRLLRNKIVELPFNKKYNKKQIVYDFQSCLEKTSHLPKYVAVYNGEEINDYSRLVTNNIEEFIDDTSTLSEINELLHDAERFQSRKMDEEKFEFL